MARPCDIHDNIHTFSTILHTQVCETDSQIRSLWNQAKLLARGYDLDNAVQNTADSKNDDLDQENEEQIERRLIHELEQARLDLVMEIQEETFITQKLTDMVRECEELAGGVTAYYRNGEENEVREKRALDEYVKTISDSSIPDVAESLKQNVQRIAALQSSLYLNAREIVDTIQRDGIEMSEPEAQQKLSQVIDQLNTKFDSLVTRSQRSV